MRKTSQHPRIIKNFSCIKIDSILIDVLIHKQFCAWGASEQLNSYISIIHISDESKPNKTFIDVSSLSSIATSSSSEIKQEAFVETIFEENFSSSNSSLGKENLDNSKRDYQLLYAMTKRQFDLMETYFKKLEKNGYIQKNELKSHILSQVLDRKNVCKANEKQISRAIDSLESSNDANITLREK
ncbi:hypothetical protein BpHYR1_038055 [Brachionus plicatilis]|uniref:Uncharacterized protein n=1 Tax=Brachionus plicatilis TaxID=10195 RepID=A0A3M7P2Z5_BRAPC|nr:hypothetical protein BpHYR1_038055 [Brachionus plicatilis]